VGKLWLFIDGGAEICQKSGEISQKSGRQMCDMKQVPHSGHEKILDAKLQNSVARDLCNPPVYHKKRNPVDKVQRL